VLPPTVRDLFYPTSAPYICTLIFHEKLSAMDLVVDLLASTLWGFHQQLRQVSLHLLTNAIDRMRQGGTLTLRMTLGQREPCVLGVVIRGYMFENTSRSASFRVSARVGYL
jgi:hypothetical protein